MKALNYLLSVTTALIMYSCSSGQSYYSSITSTADYSAANQNGKVYLTESNTVNFNYEPIASIVITQFSGKEIVKIAESDKYYIIKGQKAKKVLYGDGKWKCPTLQTAVEEASKVAIQMGGNAIINLKTDIITTQKSKDTKIVVSGMVVKQQ